jgi:hypothetical protein
MGYGRTAGGDGPLGSSPLSLDGHRFGLGEMQFKWAVEKIQGKISKATQGGGKPVSVGKCCKDSADRCTQSRRAQVASPLAFSHSEGVILCTVTLKV